MLNTKQKISFALSALLISSQVYAIDVSYQSHIKPSNIALDAVRNKGGNAPKITQANNGIPVVDITDANNAGISNNYFTDFNVGKEGLIFNNSKDLFVNTTLAGYINGNSNLTHEASLILTQVTGSNPSSLLGVMEIAGKRADLIIANPNGITCNGCGVLNAKSFTLSTGFISQEEIDRVNNINEINKTLTMMTQRGHINIEALNASNVEKLNIIAKSASVNGNLLASDLRFILGENKVFFDLSNKSDASLLLYEAITTKNAEGEEQKALALDVAHLGSVVANSIYLVATDEGVGVKNSGTMATIGSKESGDGGFVIDVNGIVTISTPQSGKSTLDKDGSAPTLSSSANLEIKAKELHNGSIISADTDVNITADKVENVSRYEVYWETTEYNRSGKTYYVPWYTNDWLQWKYNEHIVQEQRVKFETFSPAIIQAGNNLTITADSVKNDMGNLNATNEAVFNTTEKFENTGTLLQKRITDKEIRKTYNDGGKTHITSDYYVKIDAILPQFNIQDLVLSNQENILSNALVFASTPTYTQEDRSRYTDLSSYLASSSYQEYVKSHYDRDPNYSDALLQKEIEFAVQKDTYRQQNAQAINTVFDNLERRLQETEEAKKNINPNELTSAGISAESVKIEGGNITNKSLIQAGHIAIIGDAVLNENGTIVSRGDLNIQAGDFKNFGADLIAGNDITINADNVEIGTKELKTENSENNSVTHIASNLSSKNISITSNGNATFTSVNMEATQDLLIKAKDNVTFETAQDVRFNKSISLDSDSNFFKSTITTTTTTTTTKTNIANSLKGNNISITAGNNLTGFNVKADATENLAMSAGNNLTLSTKADEIYVYEEKVKKSLGFSSQVKDNANRKSVEIAFGAEAIKTTTNISNKTHNNQVLSANNISLTSGKTTSLQSINTNSSTITINASDVNIETLNDEYKESSHTKSYSYQVGLDLGVSMNPLGDGVTARLGYTQTSGEKSYSKQENVASSSNIKANNITITTKKNKFSPIRGDINILGSNLEGEKITLTGKEVNIKAQENTTTSQSNSDLKSFNLGMNAGINLIDFATIGGYGGINGGAGSESSNSTTHTASSISGANITINAKNDTNIIGSSINASGDTTIKANNVYLGSTTDTHLDYKYDYNIDASVDAGYSYTTIFNTNVNAGINGDANLNAETKINNSSINSNNLTITTSKKKILEGVKLGNSLKENLKIVGDNIIHSLVKGNGSLTLNGGNINAKNDAKITLVDNLIISSQHDTSIKGDANLATNVALRGNGLLSGILMGGGEVNAKGETTLNSMSGISAGSVQISTSYSKESKDIETGAGVITGIALGVVGKEVGQIITYIASDKIGEAMQGKYSQEEIKKTQNFVKSLGKPLGNALQKNHKEIANVVFETVKGGNTSISNGYIQSTDSSKVSSISTDKLVYHDMGNLKFDTTQKISIVGAVSPFFALAGFGIATAIDKINKRPLNQEGLISNALLNIPLYIALGGNPINAETSKNHSSISSSIQITSTNQSDITRGDKQKEPSNIRKDKMNTQAIKINLGEII